MEAVKTENYMPVTDSSTGELMAEISGLSMPATAEKAVLTS
ncbi:hypothetical protein [Dethiobacter alkaliphilus]|nr:hypothetical protein [Dethiobacter alkaliphilus]